MQEGAIPCNGAKKERRKHAKSRISPCDQETKLTKNTKNANQTRDTTQRLEASYTYTHTGRVGKRERERGRQKEEGKRGERRRGERRREGREVTDAHKGTRGRTTTHHYSDTHTHTHLLCGSCLHTHPCFCRARRERQPSQSCHCRA